MEEGNLNNEIDLLEEVTSLCKHRGFIFPSAAIYGGFRSTYDYGPLGSLMLRNIKNEWFKSIVQTREEVELIDAAILSSPRIWEASGHLKNFTDPLVDCRDCKERFRKDQIDEVCPNCGSKNLTDARDFNLMFKTQVGPVESEGSAAYLRPETAQGMFVNFMSVMRSSRKKPPFGIAQLGRSFRNEITPGNFVFRTREFEQMELEYFVPPAEADRWFDYWCQERIQWYKDLGIKQNSLRLRAHQAEELSHYSSKTSDIEFLFPWGWGELEGIAHRGDYDLTQHSKCSGEKLEYFDQETQTRYVPHVIEPAAGSTRAMMAFILDAYTKDEVGGESRTLLRLHPRLAPYSVAVLPLSKKEELIAVSKDVFKTISKTYVTAYDDTQSIGKRYRRQDEIGTPVCITIDFDSVEDKSVTIRDRDTTSQTRVKIEKLLLELPKVLGF